MMFHKVLYEERRGVRMNNNMYRKGVVFVIVVLFVGVSVIPCRSRNNSKINVVKGRIDVEE